VWAAGEVACHSLHGANRLGCNSTAECLAWGAISGREISKYLEGKAGKEAVTRPSDSAVREEEDRIFKGLLGREGAENPYAIRRELREVMDHHAGVYRDGELLREGLERVRGLAERFKKVSVADKSRVYNSNLVHVLETENLLELAEVVLAGALAREESRGGHARTDFPKRDDERFLKHTLAVKTQGGPKLSYKPARITRWKPVARQY
jgi:succinate dehydrogenase / fumarate reductase flavoprotein subunit